MANVKVCDRCKKILSDRRAVIKFKPDRYLLDVKLFKPARYYGGGDICDAHTEHDLCDKCTADLIKFLEGPSSGSTENSRKEH